MTDSTLRNHVSIHHIFQCICHILENYNHKQTVMHLKYVENYYPVIRGLYSSIQGYVLYNSVLEPKIRYSLL
jgi:hypothetical protein